MYCLLLARALPVFQKFIIFSHLFRLSHEWQAYISRTHKLRKTFISVKGIYYQVMLHMSSSHYIIWKNCVLSGLPCLLYCYPPIKAEVEGQKITWVTPHAMQQVLPDDVDYNVMLTFLEFYEVSVQLSIKFYISYCHLSFIRGMLNIFISLLFKLL